MRESHPLPLFGRLLKRRHLEASIVKQQVGTLWLFRRAKVNANAASPRNVILAFILLSVSGGCAVTAQEVAGQRSQELAAALDKTKYKKKEKRDFVVEFYIDIKNRPVARKSAAEYAGLYVCDDGLNKLDLKVAPDGTTTGSGTDTDMNVDKQMTFTLSGARIDGALLRAAKVYENGAPEPFEAAFVDRTTSTGKNAQAIETTKTEFGLGFIRTNGQWTSRMFLKKN